MLEIFRRSNRCDQDERKKMKLINYRLADLNKGACQYVFRTQITNQKYFNKIFYNTLLFHPVLFFAKILTHRLKCPHSTEPVDERKKKFCAARCDGGRRRKQIGDRVKWG